jgi:hypothetical protein
LLLFCLPHLLMLALVLLLLLLLPICCSSNGSYTMLDVLNVSFLQGNKQCKSTILIQAIAHHLVHTARLWLRKQELGGGLVQPFTWSY